MSNSRINHDSSNKRPLSPHLQIYKPLINMVMSILHRMTGAALYFGSLFLGVWLCAVASGPEAYGMVEGVLKSWPGLLVLFGYTWALMHHALGGLRHFIWDFGFGYTLKVVDQLSWGTLLGSSALTALIWIMVL
ncbi:MAG: succinate dehydrogenase, cytochrome b556 subunit [Hyphomicrobium sp.]